jgi:signal transduction histidine kinase
MKVGLGNKKETTVREILKQGIVSSLLLSALVGEGIVFGWYIFSQIRLRKDHENLVREVVFKDVSELTSAYAKGEPERVITLLEESLDKLSIECAYLQLDREARLVKGDSELCARKRRDGHTHWNPLKIGSGNVALGPLEYTLLASQLTRMSDFNGLLVGFLVVFFLIILTWVVFARMLKTAILDPLQELTQSLQKPKFEFEAGYACRELAVLSFSLSEYKTKLEKSARLGAMADVARQVAHDIRSPLTALEVVAASASELPEEKRILVRAAVTRITDIANSLLKRSHDLAQAPNLSGNGPQEELSLQLLSTLVENMVTEKRLQLGEGSAVEVLAELGPESYGLFSKIQPTEFKRMLSNLINNAIEAISGKGIVKVGLAPSPQGISLRVWDTGRGIAPEILPKLMQKGATFGKPGGSGLGLFHARTSVEAWRGKLHLHSVPTKGTSVEVALPRENSPDWFVPELKLRRGMGIIVLDDDTSIHGIWRQRLKPFLPLLNLEVMNFSTPDEIFRWHSGQWAQAEVPRGQDLLYLFDYELIGEPINGLEIIERLGLQTQAVLVTSHYEEEKLRAWCHRLGIRLIPKSLARFVPIVFEGEWSESYPQRAR